MVDMYESENTANAANRMGITDWSYHLQEQSSRKFVVNQRSVCDHTSGTADIGNKQSNQGKRQLRAPRGDSPWEGQSWRPRGLALSVQLSLKFQWKSLLIEKRGVEMEVNWDKETASLDQLVHSDNVSWASGRG